MSRVPFAAPGQFQPPVTQRHLKDEVAHCVGGVISPLLMNVALHGLEEAAGVRASVPADRIDVFTSTPGRRSVRYDITTGKRSGLGGSQHGVRDGSLSRSRRAATDSQYPPKPARPRGAGPAYPASDRTLLLYPVAHNPAAAVIASQPSVRHQGVEQRKRGPATRPTRPTGRGMRTTVKLNPRLRLHRRQAQPQHDHRPTRCAPRSTLDARPPRTT
jgi:hypothetical protein